MQIFIYEANLDEPIQTLVRTQLGIDEESSRRQEEFKRSANSIKKLQVSGPNATI